MKAEADFLNISERNKLAFEALREAMKNNPIALVGAGASMSLGYPSWSGLMNLLHQELSLTHSHSAPPKYIHQLARLDDQLWKAEEYKRLIGQTGYNSLIYNTFKSKGASPSQLLDILVRLSFAHVLTTNYDPSLEMVHANAGKKLSVIDWSDRKKAGMFLRAVSSPSDEKYFVYLHGKYDNPGQIILTERDYAERYLLADEASKKLFALFMVRQVVFIGFSLSDPELMNLIRSIQGYTQSDIPMHFVILPLSEENEKKEGYEGATAGLLNGKYGIEPVFYRARPGHEQLLDVLLQLERGGGDASNIALMPTFDPDDPEKGKWGGKAESNGRKLSAKVSDTEIDDWFCVDMLVESTDSGRPLEGLVKFHLHPTFKRKSVTVKVKNGIAEYQVKCYGAFTVGVEADMGQTRLELDLSTLPNAPMRFRMQ